MTVKIVIFYKTKKLENKKFVIKYFLKLERLTLKNIVDS